MLTISIFKKIYKKLRLSWLNNNINNELVNSSLSKLLCA